MKVIAIENEGLTSPTIFVNNESKEEPVQCAFDLTQTCSPNCAACDIVGQKVYCNRGVKEDFCLGLMVK